jgi:hypothetical protein
MDAKMQNPIVDKAFGDTMQFKKTDSQNRPNAHCVWAFSFEKGRNMWTGIYTPIEPEFDTEDTTKLFVAGGGGFEGGFYDLHSDTLVILHRDTTRFQILACNDSTLHLIRLRGK